MLSDKEIQETAEQYIRNQSIQLDHTPLKFVIGPTVEKSSDNDHENEILGWRMATEAHLETIDRLREEIRQLTRENLMLQSRIFGHKPAIDQLSDEIKTKARLQKSRLFPDVK